MYMVTMFGALLISSAFCFLLSRKIKGDDWTSKGLRIGFILIGISLMAGFILSLWLYIDVFYGTKQEWNGGW